MQITFEVCIRLVQTRETVECDRDLKFDGDYFSEVYIPQTNVTLLKIKLKVRISNFGGQLEHR